MTDNIIYSDIDAGILIVQELNSSVEKMNEFGSYPIVVVRDRMGTRFTTIDKMPRHQWQHKIIMDAFKKIGWPVKVTVNGRFYSLKRRKDRFKFKLKYGSN